MHEVLKAKKILVTRPAMLADTLCTLIQVRGGRAIHLPAIDIQPPADKNHVIQLLSDLSRYHIGIFVSQNAVRWTIDFLGGDIERLNHLVLVAIGQSTAKKLRQAGIKQVVYAKGQVDSESLLELTELQASEVCGRNILIFRGTGGRELLANTLRERGANVDYAEVYQRAVPKYDDASVDNIWNAERPDVVVITSAAGLQNLFDMLSSEQQRKLLDTQLVVIGKRLSVYAQRLGFNKIPVVANEANDEGILKAILRIIGAQK
ncbi:MAG: uroporphyrinogen synthase [Gammaproteobacteria bacterium]|nr:uroporphyrinogen synthase [Gammaproteobacteria bacterium]